MKCPIDTDTDLAITERSGVEIDYCPKCRGVWLDRGELDKIIDRASAELSAPPPAPPQAAPSGDPLAPRQGPLPPPPRWDSSDPYRRGGYGHGYKRKSILKEIFDF